MTQAVRLIVGLLSDKDAAAYLEAFDLPRYHLVLTRPPSHRAAEPGDIFGQTRFRYATIEIVDRLDDALEQVHTAPENLIAVAGSLRMAAAARESFGLLPAADLVEAKATRLVFDSPAYLAKLSTPLPIINTASAGE
jgi:folylpolyglutamate synthase/dihydropteroate synthase